MIQSPPPTTSTTKTRKDPPPITHSGPIRSLLPLALTSLASQTNFSNYLISGSGDLISVYDVTAFADYDSSSPGEAELVATVDAHSHDVTALEVWIKDGEAGKEAWIVSGSLDGTVRRWKFAGKYYLGFQLPSVRTIAV